MPSTPRDSVTHLLAALHEGEGAALDRLFPFVYEELRRIARRERRRWQGAYTVNTTALVHEAYLNLVDQEGLRFNSRAHFLGVAGKAMRQVLVDYARRRGAQKRGGDVPKVSLDDLAVLPSAGPAEMTEERAHLVLTLDDALSRLAERSERQSRIVECRVFAQMTVAETAEALDVSTATVKRGWSMAQTWLYRELTAA